MYAILSLLACLTAFPMVCGTGLPLHIAGVLKVCSVDHEGREATAGRAAEAPPVRAVIAGARL